VSADDWHRVEQADVPNLACGYYAAYGRTPCPACLRRPPVGSASAKACGAGMRDAGGRARRARSGDTTGARLKAAGFDGGFPAPLPCPLLAHPGPRYPVQNAWWHRRDASQRGTIAAAEAVA